LEFPNASNAQTSILESHKGLSFNRAFMSKILKPTEPLSPHQKQDLRHWWFESMFIRKRGCSFGSYSCLGIRWKHSVPFTCTHPSVPSSCHCTLVSMVLIHTTS